MKYIYEKFEDEYSQLCRRLTAKAKRLKRPKTIIEHNHSANAQFAEFFDKYFKALCRAYGVRGSKASIAFYTVKSYSMDPASIEDGFARLVPLM